MGRLGVPAEADAGQTIGQTLQAVVNTQLAALSVRQLADIMWGLGKAEVPLDERWIDKVWVTMLRKNRQVCVGVAAWSVEACDQVCGRAANRLLLIVGLPPARTGSNTGLLEA